MTLVIAFRSEALESRWGWWSEDDSLATPLAVEPLDAEDLHGGSRLSVASGPGGAGATASLSSDLRRGALDAKLSVRRDSSVRRTRQSLVWSEGGSTLALGDLGVWAEEPLLEGRTTRSRGGSPWDLLGSGQAPAGVDLALEGLPIDPSSSVRMRVSEDPQGGSRASGTGGIGWLRLGFLARSDSPDGAMGLVGIRMRSGSIRLDASHLGVPGSGAWRLAVESGVEGYSQELALLHLPARRLHGRLPGLAPGSTLATFASRCSGDGRSIAANGQILSDNAGSTTLRASLDASADLGGLRARIRSRASNAGPRGRRAVVPGITRAGGRLRPWTELDWEEGRPLAASAGVRWIERSWSFELSGRGRSEGSPEWSGSSMLHGGSGSFAMSLATRSGSLQGGGSWSFRW